MSTIVCPKLHRNYPILSVNFFIPTAFHTPALTNEFEYPAFPPRLTYFLFYYYTRRWRARWKKSVSFLSPPSPGPQSHYYKQIFFRFFCCSLFSPLVLPLQHDVVVIVPRSVLHNAAFIYFVDTIFCNDNTHRLRMTVARRRRRRCWSSKNRFPDYIYGRPPLTHPSTIRATRRNKRRDTPGILESDPTTTLADDNYVQTHFRNGERGSEWEREFVYTCIRDSCLIYMYTRITNAIERERTTECEWETRGRRMRSHAIIV